MSTYRGFSSKNFLKNKSFKIYDIDVIKDDLNNHLNTVIGSRYNQPTFGSIIPLMKFEQLDEITALRVYDDFVRVIQGDPRVAIFDSDYIALFDQNTLMLFADVEYIELNTRDRIELNLEFGE